MSNTSAIATNKYVSLTTYTKSGVPKPTPVWIVELADGRVGFTTSGVSWKARRIRNDPKVTLRPSDQRGKVTDGAIEVTGQAVLVEGSEFAEVGALVKKKYGLWVPLIGLVNTIVGVFKRQQTKSDCAVVITLD